MPVSEWRGILVDPGSWRHLVLMHSTDAYLGACVATWAARGITAGGGAVLVGREEHCRTILQEMRSLGIDVDLHLETGRLAVLDARATLATFVRDGKAPRPIFRKLVVDMLALVEAACPGPRAEVRAWGEMMSVRHEDAHPGLAQELELVWQELLADRAVRLLCSYRLTAAKPHEFDAAASRVLDEVFGDEPLSDPSRHLARRGALAVGNEDRSAIIVPLDGWHRPARSK